MNAPVRYGSRVAGIGVYLFHGQFLSKSRTVQALSDLFGVVVAAATLVAWTGRIAAQVTGKALVVIGDRIAGSAVVHFDETGLRVSGRLHWMHSASTPTDMLLTVHRRRGTKGMDAAEIRPHPASEGHPQLPREVRGTASPCGRARFARRAPVGAVFDGAARRPLMPQVERPHDYGTPTRTGYPFHTRRRYRADVPAIAPYLAQWQPHPEDAAHLRSAVAVARFAIMSPELTDKHRRRLLNEAIWYRTEAASKIRLRYRSGGVLALGATAPASWRKLIRHEHVQTRASLIALMLADPDRVGAILAEATACLVTVTEHDRLTEHDSSADGWARYRLAGVDVYDFSSDPAALFIHATSRHSFEP